MDATDELFTYLGCIGFYSHFFMHSLTAKNMPLCDQAVLSCEVYNAMIHEGLVAANQKCVMFTMVESGVNVFVVNHEDFVSMTYDTRNLIDAFVRLLNADRAVTTMAFRVKMLGHKVSEIHYYDQIPILETKGVLTAADVPILSITYIESTLNS